MKNNSLHIILGCILLIMCSCEPIIEEQAARKTVRAAFDAVWADMDTNYVYIEERGYDWDEIHSRYTRKIKKAKEEELTSIIQDLVDELADPAIRIYMNREEFTYYPDTFKEQNLHVVIWSNFLSNNDYYQWIDKVYFEGSSINRLIHTGDSSAVYLYIQPTAGVFIDEANLLLFWQEYLVSYASGIKGVILDTRADARMTETQMLSLCKYFLPEGNQELFVVRERIHPNKGYSLSEGVPFYTECNGLYAHTPLVILNSFQTANYANVMTYLLQSKQKYPAVVVNTHQTLGGGGLSESHIYHEEGSYSVRVDYPTKHLSNKAHSTFNQPLNPDIQIPYDTNHLSMTYTDPYIVTALEAIDQMVAGTNPK